MKKFLLICGIISSLLYIGTDLLAAKLWEGYSAASQMVSEFIAINAPTRPLVVVLFFIYSLLIFAFGAGVWLSAEKKTALRLTAVGLIGKEVLGVVVTLFFPIHLRGVEGTLSDTMHGVMTMVGNLFMLMALLSAGSFWKAFWSLLDRDRRAPDHFRLFNGDIYTQRCGQPANPFDGGV